MFHRLYLCIFILLITSVAASAQTPASPSGWTPQDISDMQKIQQAALHNDYGYERLAYLTDSIGSRPSGSAQHAAAAEYVAGEMRKLGLDTRLEAASVHHWVR